jgi:hypothetical protein
MWNCIISNADGSLELSDLSSAIYLEGCNVRSWRTSAQPLHTHTYLLCTHVAEDTEVHIRKSFITCNVYRISNHWNTYILFTYYTYYLQRHCRILQTFWSEESVEVSLLLRFHAPALNCQSAWNSKSIDMLIEVVPTLLFMLSQETDVYHRAWTFFPNLDSFVISFIHLVTTKVDVNASTKEIH